MVRRLRPGRLGTSRRVGQRHLAVGVERGHDGVAVSDEGEVVDRRSGEPGLDGAGLPVAADRDAQQRRLVGVGIPHCVLVGLQSVGAQTEPAARGADGAARPRHGRSAPVRDPPDDAARGVGDGKGCQQAPTALGCDPLDLGSPGRHDVEGAARFSGDVLGLLAWRRGRSGSGRVDWTPGAVPAAAGPIANAVMAAAATVAATAVKPRLPCTLTSLVCRAFKRPPPGRALR